MECVCPSGGGIINNGHIRYPSYGATQKEKKEQKMIIMTQRARLQPSAWRREAAATEPSLGTKRRPASLASPPPPFATWSVGAQTAIAAWTATATRAPENTAAKGEMLATSQNTPGKGELLAISQNTPAVGHLTEHTS